MFLCVPVMRWRAAAFYHWRVGRWAPHGAPVWERICCSLCFCLFGFGSNPAAMFPRLTFHPSPETHTTCQIHSVITGLIKTVHCEATGSLRGQCACMDDTHAQIHTCTDPVIVPSCCVKSPQETNKQMMTSGDGWSHLTSESPAFIGFCIGHTCNVIFFLPD